mmetsp:Transcript_29070/g.35445  ORF Transcript_29070/g.35445 Transcript_29070/m.35445 type:complete len:94 (-) Transcript_29070:358-639(-)
MGFAPRGIVVPHQWGFGLPAGIVTVLRDGIFTLGAIDATKRIPTLRDPPLLRTHGHFQDRFRWRYSSGDTGGLRIRTVEERVRPAAHKRRTGE